MDTWRVSGPHPVFGHEHGTTFERDIPARQQAQLLKSGAIKKSKAKTVDAVDATPTEPEE